MRFFIFRSQCSFVTYLMEYAFTFTFGIPTDLCIVCDSINRPGDLDFRPFDL